MMLRALRVRHFGKFGPAGLALEGLSPGVNVLAAPNEFGKSTLVRALIAALFSSYKSTAQPVRALAPFGEATAPTTVEVDFDIGERRYRLLKQFNKSRAAVLSDRASGDVLGADRSAENQLSHLLGLTAPRTGPTGLLWVEQGASLAPPDGGEAGRRVLSDLLEQEVGHMSGADKASQVAAAVALRLETFVTAKTRKPTAAYRAALADLADGDARLSALEAKRAATDAAHETLRQGRRRLADLDAPDAKARHGAALADAEKAHAAALQASEVTQRLDAASRLAQAEYRQAEDRLAGAQATLDAVAKAEQDINALQQATSALVAELTPASEADRIARDAADAARETVEAARTQWQRARGNTAAAGAAVALAEKEPVLDAATALEKDISDLKAKIASTSITQKDLTALRSLQHAIAVATAQRDASRPIVGATLVPGAAVTMGGAPLPDGSARPLADDGVIEIGGIGTLSIQIPNDQHREQVGALETELTSALEALGVPDVAAAEAAFTEKERAAQALAMAEERQRLMAPNGIAALQEEVARLRLAAQPWDPDAPALDAATTAFDDAQRRLSEATDAAQRSNAALAPLLERQTSLRTQIEERQHRLTASRALLTTDQDPSIFIQTLTEAAATARAVMDAAAARLADHCEAAPDPKVTATALARLKEAATQREAQRLTLAQDVAAAAATIQGADADGVEEQCRQAHAAQETIRTTIDGFEREIAALSLLQDELAQAQRAAFQQIIQPVAQTLKPLIARLLPAAEVHWEDGFQPASLTRQGRAEAVDTLSGGTKEQIGVLTRLAYAQLMARRGRPMPVVLDDALGFGDDERLEAMFDALHLAANEAQVLVLTCHERAFDTLGGTRLAPSAWPETPASVG